MFYDDVILVLNAILDHTLDNDIRFQVKKLKKKISLKKFTEIDEDSQKKQLFILIEEVRFGYDTVKPHKIRAINTVEKILKHKLGIA